ncbi:hypothetical protein NX794_19470 [Streptomyces sp. LP11]|uniref:Integral membrane protein n=1 Tax=Streptomyces pyxinicus TaxID=2970331 RepID=A0ABT2B4M0_9ACTN|nr:hypothetical protein [Streptomyces sp. LP11]MCS0603377.1 hypothetical protein [Streptomyces sp. LP11]
MTHVDAVAERGRRGRRAGGWGWFLGWLAVGACGATGLATVVSAGLALALVAAGAAGLLVWRGPRNAIAGLATGLAVPLLYLAYLNRGGPGTVCHAVPGGQTCTDEYTPVPFLAIGCVLFCAGFLLFATLGRRADTAA